MRWTGTLGVLGAAAAGYAIGTVPSADVAARIASSGAIDLRSAGSGNPGGVNAGLVLGRRWGLAVMAADIGKATAACRLGRRIAGDAGQHVAGTAAVVGHCWPAWNGFRGGKGVACTVGQCLATFPVYFPIDLGVAAAVVAGPWRRRAATATAVSSAAWVATALLWWRRGWSTGSGGSASPWLPLAAAASSAVVLDRFRRGKQP